MHAPGQKQRAREPACCVRTGAGGAQLAAKPSPGTAGHRLLTAASCSSGLRTPSSASHTPRRTSLSTLRETPGRKSGKATDSRSDPLTRKQRYGNTAVAVALVDKQELKKTAHVTKHAILQTAKDINVFCNHLPDIKLASTATEDDFAELRTRNQQAARALQQKVELAEQKLRALRHRIKVLTDEHFFSHTHSHAAPADKADESKPEAKQKAIQSPIAGADQTNDHQATEAATDSTKDDDNDDSG